ncbi:MAG: S1C family serine protease [Anaerolineae bacterium]|nr:S1C family serine protease [Anaerolineae bacterium]
MNRNKVGLAVGAGCIILVLLFVIALSLVFPLFNTIAMPFREVSQPAAPSEEQTFDLLPTLTPATQGVEPQVTSSPAAISTLPGLEANSLTALYRQLNPGVVNIQVYVERETLSGVGAGSGFILDNEGHIVTNHHVVADAT